jgi:hypothetical protein
MEDANGKPTAWTCHHCPDRVQKGNLQSARLIRHTLDCHNLRTQNPDLYDEVVDSAANNSLGALLTDLGQKDTAGLCTRALEILKQLDPQKPKTGDQSQLPLDTFRAAAKRKRTELIENLQAEADHLILQLICVCGMSPQILRSKIWAALMRLLNPDYTVTSESTFVNNLIPKEAAFVRKEQTRILARTRDLTLSTDGSSTQW